MQIVFALGCEFWPTKGRAYVSDSKQASFGKDCQKGREKRRRTQREYYFRC